MEINLDFSLGGILTLIFVVLKLIGIINWSWWWILSPLWISIILYVIILLVFYIFIKNRRF